MGFATSGFLILLLVLSVFCGLGFLLSETDHQADQIRDYENQIAACDAALASARTAKEAALAKIVRLEDQVESLQPLIAEPRAAAPSAKSPLELAGLPPFPVLALGILGGSALVGYLLHKTLNGGPGNLGKARLARSIPQGDGPAVVLRPKDPRVLIPMDSQQLDEYIRWRRAGSPTCPFISNDEVRYAGRPMIADSAL